MLTANDITYSIGENELIKNVSLSLAPGKLHLIIGPNGAGKSTLIKVLARSVRPQRGTVEYDGIDISTVPEAELAKRRAVLSQAVEIAFPLSVREVAMMGRYPHFGGSPGPTDERIVDEMLDYFDVAEFANRNYQTLSGGEKQRVNFARVLTQLWKSDGSAGDARPSRYLFLDEPLTFLDVHHQIDFMHKVRDLSYEGDIVIVGVVHDLNLAARFADRLVLIDEGKIVADGDKNEVLTASNIRDVFRVEPAFYSTDDGDQISFSAISKT